MTMGPQEESIEQLIAKLNKKGTKVKIVKEGDEEDTPMKTPKTIKGKTKQPTTESEDKENRRESIVKAARRDSIEEEAIGNQAEFEKLEKLKEIE